MCPSFLNFLSYNILHFQAVGPPNSPIKKYLMQSYYNRYTNLHDSDFERFMYQEVTSGFCEVLPDNHNVELRLSVLKRNLIGEGSHRSVSTLMKFRTKQLKSLSKLLSYSCELIIIERLPSGIFADPFELQRLVQRGGKSYSPAFQFQRKKMGKKFIFLISGISPYFLKSVTLLIAVFSDIAVFGDTNLELPSFLSNCSAVEIHLDVDPNILLEPIDVNIELPLHARYQVRLLYLNANFLLSLPFMCVCGFICICRCLHVCICMYIY